MTDGREDSAWHPLGLPEAALEPLGDSGAGADPRHGARFEQLRAEVARLGGSDHEQVAACALAILREEGKDLRVIGYLALAELCQRGLHGLRVALAVAWRALDAFGAAIHPRRAAGRERAAEWLAGQRILDLLERAPDAGDARALSLLRDEIARLEVALSEHGVAADSALAPLRRKVNERAANAQAESSAHPGEPAEPPSGTAEPVSSPRAARAAPESERELGQWLRPCLAYLRDQGDWLRLAALGRAWRWGGLRSVTAVEGMRTRIDAPREQPLQTVRARVAEGRWTEAFLAAESALLEPGGHLAIELQALSERAAQAAGRPDVAGLVRVMTAELLERIPEIPRLAFSDGQPFVPPDLQHWVSSLLAPDPSEEANAEAQGEVEDERRREIAEAEAAAAREGVEAAERRLLALHCRDGRQRAEVALGRARACMQAGRPELAVSLLEALDEEIESRRLADWDPEHALAVWRALDQALQAAERGRQLPDGARRRAELRARVARVDLAAAARLP